MSFTVPVHFIQAYNNNVMFLLQQKGGKLKDRVMQATYTGMAAKVVEQFGAVKPVKNLSRHADTPLISTPDDARWCYPNDYDWADLIDTQDRLRMLLDPTSSYSQNAANSMRRAQDDEILQAFFTAAQTGQTGATSTTFPSGQIVGVNVGGTASNLNVAKLRAAKRLFMAAGTDLETEMLQVAITSGDHDGLLNEIQVQNLDYTNKPVLVDGRVTGFMGFNFVHVEFTDTGSYQTATVAALTSGSNRLCPAWATSGMHLGTWQDVDISVDRRPDKRNATQVYAKTTVGATRVEEKRVVQITATG